MIDKWIMKNDRNINIPNLKVNDLTEKDNCNFDELKKFLANTTFFHIEDIDIFKDRNKGKNLEKIERHLMRYVIPDPNARFAPQQGFLGEIISAEILRYLYGHMLPVHKLRYKELKDAAMRGKADVVTCEINNNGPEINFSEVKSKSIYISPKDSLELSKKACKGVFSNDVEFPEILKLVADKHRKEHPDDYELMQIFDEALDNADSYSKKFHIFFIFEKQHWKEDCLNFFDAQRMKTVPHLNIHIFLIDSLKELVSDVYGLIPEIAEGIANE